MAARCYLSRFIAIRVRPSRGASCNTPRKPLHDGRRQYAVSQYQLDTGPAPRVLRGARWPPRAPTAHGPLPGAEANCRMSRLSAPFRGRKRRTIPNRHLLSKPIEPLLQLQRHSRPHKTSHPRCRLRGTRVSRKSVGHHQWISSRDALERRNVRRPEAAPKGALEAQAVVITRSQPQRGGLEKPAQGEKPVERKALASANAGVKPSSMKQEPGRDQI